MDLIFLGSLDAVFKPNLVRCFVLISCPMMRVCFCSDLAFFSSGNQTVAFCWFPLGLFCSLSSMWRGDSGLEFWSWSFVVLAAPANSVCFLVSSLFALPTRFNWFYNCSRLTTNCVIPVIQCGFFLVCLVLCVLSACYECIGVQNYGSFSSMAFTLLYWIDTVSQLNYILVLDKHIASVGEVVYQFKSVSCSWEHSIQTELVSISGLTVWYFQLVFGWWPEFWKDTRFIYAPGPIKHILSLLEKIQLLMALWYMYRRNHPVYHFTFIWTDRLTSPSSLI